MYRVDLDALSTEYVRVRIEGEEDGFRVNPSGSPVQMAFMGSGLKPAVSDWHDAEWEDAGGIYYARALVGPNSDVGALVPDTYTVWVKFTIAPESPVKATSRLYVQ